MSEETPKKEFRIYLSEIQMQSLYDLRDHLAELGEDITFIQSMIESAEESSAGEKDLLMIKEEIRSKGMVDKIGAIRDLRLRQDWLQIIKEYDQTSRHNIFSRQDSDGKYVLTINLKEAKEYVEACIAEHIK